MEENMSYKGMYMTVKVLEDRIRISKNPGYTERINDESYDDIMFEDIDKHHIECYPAKSMLIQGYISIPLKKKMKLVNTFKGNTKEIKIWYKTNGNEIFQELREILMK